MNHFMLPEGAGDSGRYGSYAMELLINELMKKGASRLTLEAKIFGGGAVIGGMSSINVGERNTQFVIDYLQTERIPIVSRDVLEIYPRKVCFLPASGKAMVKRLAPTHNDAFVAQDRLAAVAPNIASLRTASMLEATRGLMARAGAGLAVIAGACLAASLIGVVVVTVDCLR
jgi:chemotaxis protein CheD